ncbi:hypothetical protein MPER_08115 [Moniliophthora perniciosa FA553]|nr:hypothetical protein MPER_08115 [Moniliophthora perniciosa FA553]
MTPIGTRTIFQMKSSEERSFFALEGGSVICRGMTEAVMRHGADAAIFGRKLDRLTQTAKELSESTGRTCIPTQGDVRQPNSLKEAVEKTIEKFGRIDYVICGAAGNFLAPISGLSENAFRTVMEIDTIGSYNTVKATLEHVRKSKGSYIFVSATLHYNATPYQVHVSAAKAGVDALSAVLAIEEGPHGIRSNVIAPGPIANTEGMSRLSNQKYGPVMMVNQGPVGRLGDVKDIGNATIFLFSDAASFITGQILPVDGGWEHLRTTQLPYPDSVLDPEAVKSMIKARM